MAKNEKLTLKQARKAAGMTQKQAASCIGVCQNTISNYERGICYPDVKILRRIEMAYARSYNELIFLPKKFGKTEIRQNPTS